MKKLLTLLTLLLLSFPSFAMETDWQRTSPKEEGAIRLISAGYNSEGRLVSGLHIKLDDKWHIYWKVPGDSGMSVTPDFSGSENIKRTEMLWPAPERNLFFDLEGWGYGKEVILPVISEVSDPSKPVKLAVHVKWAVCDENCIFVENNFSLEVPAGYNNVPDAEAIEKYRKQVPVALAEDSQIQLTKLMVSEKTVFVEFTNDNKFSNDLDLFIYEDSKDFRFPKPLISISDDSKTISVLTNYEVLKKGGSLTGKKLNFTLVNGRLGYETTRKIGGMVPNSDIITLAGQMYATSSATIVSNEPSITLWQAIIAAIIGGLILNIMPCVLPVILLKIFGILKHGTSDKEYIRRSFSFTIAGILFSFLLMASFVVLLKALGHSVGWGIQFQHPSFLIFLSVLLTLFAANQFGLFEIVLPQGLANRLNRHIENAGDNTPLGNFLTGAFATLLATPCTAPFVTTAISFAFAADTLSIFIIMLFMGIGLSLPYILIMISPSLVKILPRPGRWMGFVKMILGFLLFLTNFWIFVIFFNNGGQNAGFMLLFCMLATLVWLAVATKFNLDRTKTLFTTIYFIIVTFVIVLYIAGIEKEPEFMEGAWVKFSERSVQQHVEKKEVVFVDVTAAWCLTCQFNKSNVVYPMKPYFDEHKVVLMKADYTSPSAEINAYLEKHKVYGIPFNMVYGPHAKEGIKLPEILDERSIKEAVEKAK